MLEIKMASGRWPTNAITKPKRYEDANIASIQTTNTFLFARLSVFSVQMAATGMTMNKSSRIISDMYIGISSARCSPDALGASTVSPEMLV
jgi:hypothetical protein